MSAIAIPNYTVPAPHVDSPLQSIGQLMQLKSGMAELALRQQQQKQAEQNTADIKAQADQRNRDLADQNTIQELSKDPETARKLAMGDTSVLAGKIQPKTHETLNTSIAALHEKNALTAKSDLENQGTALGRIKESLLGIQQSFGDDVGKINEVLPGTIQQLDSQGLLKQAGIDPTQVPKSVTTADDLKKWEAHVGILQGINEGALAVKGKQTEQAAKEAETRQKTAEAAHQELVNKLIQGSGAAPVSGAHPIDQILPASMDAAANTGFKAAYDAALAQPPDQNGRRPAADTIAEAAAQHAAALSPSKRANEVQTKVDEEKALAPLKAQQEIAVRAGVAQAMNAAGPELSGVPIADRDKVRTEYEKSLMTLSMSAADASRIHGVIAAAQSGNKAAPAVIPLAELRGFVNRVNQSELKSVTGAGSLVDKVQGWVEGKTEGQPIPPEILKATDELASLQLQNAEQKHAGEVSAINIARGSKLPAHKAADLGFSPIGITTPASQAEFNALPKGSQFKKPNDPKVYIKQ